MAYRFDGTDSGSETEVSDSGFIQTPTRTLPRVKSAPNLGNGKRYSAQARVPNVTPRSSKRKRASHSPERGAAAVLDLSSSDSEDSVPTSSRGLKSSASAISIASTSDATFVEQGNWRGKKDGAYVWAPVDPLSFSPSQTHAVWWPGKVLLHSGSSATVKLFGDLPPSSHNPIQAKPSDLLTLLDGRSFGTLDARKCRFDEPQFTSTADEPPRKKVKRDITDIWDKAVSAALVEKIAKEDDGMPPPNVMSSRHWVSEDIDELMSSRASSLGLDLEPEIDASDESKPYVKVPGELVLAIHRASSKELYWPAKVKDRRSPTAARKRAEYLLEWCDDSADSWLNRDQFYTSGEEGFGDCKMGQVQTEEAWNETDDDETFEAKLRRALSPELPVLGADEAFWDLDFRGQVAHVIPILRATIEGRYAPALPLHNAFVKGGKGRSDLLKDDSLSRKGRMSNRQVERISTLVEHWALREERYSANRINEDEEDEDVEPERESLSPAPGPPASSRVVTPANELTNPWSPSTRPPGDQRYEALSPRERIEYCSVVLLSVTIRQLLLWRNEKRTSTILLEPAEEQDLWDESEVLLNERDWVIKILSLKKDVDDKKNKKANGGRKSVGKRVGGTSSRPVYA
ncbi:hypothetical protein DL96DRAFT_798561 [Flagelloscypha sp. PMI_526]|nr:hypothetical protein DL96DRAFT_798561 [Flagelloscypha sp. PMI_526]